jgi:hypothetical protein
VVAQVEAQVELLVQVELAVKLMELVVLVVWELVEQAEVVGQQVLVELQELQA